jgi:hypothetical protein
MAMACGSVTRWCDPPSISVPWLPNGGPPIKALAQVYRGDPDRAVWHLAASSDGPDDRIAAELEALADRAAKRGAAAVAVAALDRAARLTSQDLPRGRLLLRAAWLAYELGDLDASGGLVRDAQRLALGPPEQTLLRYMLELRQETAWPGTANIATLVEIAGQLQAIGETNRALDALEVAAKRCWRWNPDPADPGSGRGGRGAAVRAGQ